MSNPELVARMKDFFERQIASSQAMIRDLETLEADLSDPELERVVQQQEAHARQTEALEREFRRLSVEWESCKSLSEEERASVRILAHQAGELALQLSAIQEKGRQLAQGRLASIRAELGELRRGRELLGKYGHGGSGIESSFIDRKA